MSAAAPQEALLQGYLHKQSRHLKLWRIRYFMLTKNELLYSKKSGKKLRGCLLLSDFRVIEDQNRVEHTGNYVLELRSATREVFLSAATEPERIQWAAAIRAHQSEYDAATTTKHDVSATASSALLRPVSDSSLVIPVLMAHNRRAGRPNRFSKDRRDERKRQRLPKLKKSFTDVWLDDILPGSDSHSVSTDTTAAAVSTAPVSIEALCFAGIPKEVRGRAWAFVLGNKLQVNEDLYQICRARASAVRREMDLKREAAKTERVRTEQLQRPQLQQQQSDVPVLGLRSPSSCISGSGSSDGSDSVGSPHTLNSSSECVAISDDTGDDTGDTVALEPVDTAVDSQSRMLQEAVSIAEMLVAHSERSIRLVSVDMPRTFGHHALFQPGADGTARTTDVLEAYICYRPDLGYVQGMSYLAAALCFHMDSFTAFKALVSLMSTSLLFDMFRLEEKRTFHYLGVYNQILEYELPRLHVHFQNTGIDAQMYAVDWALTLFTRSLPLHLALRIWDCFVLLGTPFFFQASVGILTLYEDALLAMEADEIMRFLHNIPKSTAARDLFDAIESVTLSSREISELLAGGRLWSPDSARHIQVQFPETYD